MVIIKCDQDKPKNHSYLIKENSSKSPCYPTLDQSHIHTNEIIQDEEISSEIISHSQIYLVMYSENLFRVFGLLLSNSGLEIRI